MEFSVNTDMTWKRPHFRLAACSARNFFSSLLKCSLCVGSTLFWKACYKAEKKESHCFLLCWSLERGWNKKNNICIYIYILYFISLPTFSLSTFVSYVHAIVPGLTILHISCTFEMFYTFTVYLNVKEEISVFMKFVIFPIVASIKGQMMASN
jgi:hypothetical protein